jgi:hypothetical protein
MNQSDANACRVQATRRDHEPDAIEQGVRAGRQFSAVSVAMKNGEKPHDHRSNPEGRPGFPPHKPTATIARM